MAKHGKKYLEAEKLIDRQKYYQPAEAAELVKQVSTAKFDASVEAHLRMGLDPRKADQQIRGTIVLPNGTGKKVRVLVFAEGDASRTALEAGADFAGSDELIQQIQGGWFDFDVAVATPQIMGKVGRLGKLLGTRGLMPSPKAGTIVQPDDLPHAVKELKAGRVEFRMDKTANIHLIIGKVSFSKEQLGENLAAVLEAIMHARPASAKGSYIRRLTITPTMGPGIRIDTTQAMLMQFGA
jgi:large subunit ribosomal protein L1